MLVLTKRRRVCLDMKIAGNMFTTLNSLHLKLSLGLRNHQRGCLALACPVLQRAIRPRVIGKFTPLQRVRPQRSPASRWVLNLQESEAL